MRLGITPARVVARTRTSGARYAAIAAAALLATCAAPRAAVVSSAAGGVASAAAGPVFPGATWDSIPDPMAVGWSRASLDSVRKRLEPLATTGFIAVVGGRVLMSYGDLDTLSYLASVRKSVLAMLMGNYVAQGKLDLDKTLAQMGMDDVGGLLPAEREATVRDLISARSGVYHTASNAGDDTQFAPARGTQKHGTFMLYNNWDFNAAGAAFELQTGKNIYDALESDIARPIGMQDFNRSRQRKSGDASASQYLAYHMYLSTRDMARIGYLMLREGNWAGTQVVPSDWVRKIKSPITPVGEMNPPRRRDEEFGYGYLWWVWDGKAAAGPYKGAYTGLGAVGQHITILPELDLVVAHKTAQGQRDAAGRERTVSHRQFLDVLDVLVKSYKKPTTE
jgi:CubicO group peptidase (beta-lactamase class C family)